MNQITEDLIAQAKGFHRYGLTIAQMQVANFGEHTIAGIAYLTNPGRANRNKKVYTIMEAYEKVAGLNGVQTEGVTVYGLSREQVSVADFGERTLSMIKAMVHAEMSKDNYKLAG